MAANNKVSSILGSITAGAAATASLAKKKKEEAEAAAASRLTGSAMPTIGSGVKPKASRAASSAKPASFVTVKLPAAKQTNGFWQSVKPTEAPAVQPTVQPTNYQSNLSQTTDAPSWFNPNLPIASNVAYGYGIVQKYGKSQEAITAFNQAYGVMESQYNNAASKFYSPYRKTTSAAAQNFVNCGGQIADADGKYLSREQLQQQYSWLFSKYRISDASGNPLAPKKNSSREEQAAYYLYQYMQDVDESDAADKQFSALADEIAYKARNGARNMSDDEIIASIDWNKYPKLRTMDERAKEGRPVQLARPSQYSRESLYGIIWAARNGSTGNLDTDTVSYAMGRGKMWAKDDKTAARLDAGNPAYNPYALSATNDELNMYYGRNGFTTEEVENIRIAAINGNDETAKEYAGKLVRAEDRTAKAEAELKAFSERLSLYSQYAQSADELYAQAAGWLTDGDYPTLSGLQDSLRGVKLEDTTRAIPFSLYDVRQTIDEYYAKRADPDAAAFGRGLGIAEGDLSGREPEQTGSPKKSDAELADKANEIETQRKKLDTRTAAEILDVANYPEAMRALITEAQAGRAGYDALAAQIDQYVSQSGRAGTITPRQAFSLLDAVADSGLGDWLDATEWIGANLKRDQECGAYSEEYNAALRAIADANAMMGEVDALTPTAATFDALTEADGLERDSLLRGEYNEYAEYLNAQDVEATLFSLDRSEEEMIGADEKGGIRGKLVRAGLVNPDGTLKMDTRYADGKRQEVESQIEAAQKQLEALEKNGGQYSDEYRKREKTLQDAEEYYALRDRFAAKHGLTTGINELAVMRSAMTAYPETPTEHSAFTDVQIAGKNGMTLEDLSAYYDVEIARLDGDISTMNSACGKQLTKQIAVAESARARLAAAREHLKLEQEASRLIASDETLDAKMWGDAATFDPNGEFAFLYHTIPNGGALGDLFRGDRPATWEAVQNARHLMTDGELTAMAALYDQDPEKAKAYYAYLADNVMSVRTTQNIQDIAASLTESGWAGAIASNLISPAASLMGGVSGAAYSVAQLFRGEEINPYDDAFALNAFSSATRETTSKELLNALGEKGLDENGNPVMMPTTASRLCDFFYGAAASALENGARIMVAGGLGKAASLSLMAIQSFGGGVQQAKMSGAGDLQAVCLGAAGAIIEVGTEKLPLDSYMSMMADSGTGRGLVVDMFTNALSSFGSEFGEEGVGSLANTIADTFINRAFGDRGGFDASVAAYEANGMTHDAAYKRAVSDTLKAAAYEGLVGGVSGAMTGATATFYGRTAAKARDRQQLRKAGKVVGGELASEAETKGIVNIGSIWQQNEAELITRGNRALADKVFSPAIESVDVFDAGKAFDASYLTNPDYVQSVDGMVAWLFGDSADVIAEIADVEATVGASVQEAQQDAAVAQQDAAVAQQDAAVAQQDALGGSVAGAPDANGGASDAVQVPDDLQPTTAPRGVSPNVGGDAIAPEGAGAVETGADAQGEIVQPVGAEAATDTPGANGGASDAAPVQVPDVDPTTPARGVAPSVEGDAVPSEKVNTASDPEAQVSSAPDEGAGVAMPEKPMSPIATLYGSALDVANRLGEALGDSPTAQAVKDAAAGLRRAIGNLGRVMNADGKSVAAESVLARLAKVFQAVQTVRGAARDAVAGELNLTDEQRDAMAIFSKLAGSLFDKAFADTGARPSAVSSKGNGALTNEKRTDAQEAGSDARSDVESDATLSETATDAAAVQEEPTTPARGVAPNVDGDAASAPDAEAGGDAPVVQEAQTDAGATPDAALFQAANSDNTALQSAVLTSVLTLGEKLQSVKLETGCAAQALVGKYGKKAILFCERMRQVGASIADIADITRYAGLAPNDSETAVVVSEMLSSWRDNFGELLGDLGAALTMDRANGEAAKIVSNAARAADVAARAAQKAAQDGTVRPVLDAQADAADLVHELKTEVRAQEAIVASASDHLASTMARFRQNPTDKAAEQAVTDAMAAWKQATQTRDSAQKKLDKANDALTAARGAATDAKKAAAADAKAAAEAESAQAFTAAASDDATTKKAKADEEARRSGQVLGKISFRKTVEARNAKASDAERDLRAAVAAETWENGRAFDAEMFAGAFRTAETKLEDGKEYTATDLAEAFKGFPNTNVRQWTHAQARKGSTKGRTFTKADVLAFLREEAASVATGMNSRAAFYRDELFGLADLTVTTVEKTIVVGDGEGISEITSKVFQSASGETSGAPFTIAIGSGDFSIPNVEVGRSSIRETLDYYGSRRGNTRGQATKRNKLRNVAMNAFASIRELAKNSIYIGSYSDYVSDLSGIGQHFFVAPMAFEGEVYRVILQLNEGYTDKADPTVRLYLERIEAIKTNTAGATGPVNLSPIASTAASGVHRITIPQLLQDYNLDSMRNFNLLEQRRAEVVAAHNRKKNGGGNAGASGGGTVSYTMGSATVSSASSNAAQGRKPKHIRNPQETVRVLGRALGIRVDADARKMNSSTNKTPRAALGWFDAHSGVIALRSGQAMQITTGMHEIGHAISTRTGLTGTPDMVNRLIGAGWGARYSAAELPGEAMAEFTWRYMADGDRGASFGGGAFVDTFERAVRKAGLWSAVSSARERVQTFMNASANERLGSIIRSRSDSGEVGFREHLAGLRRRIGDAVSRTLDETRPLEQVNQAIRAQNGGTLANEFNLKRYADNRQMAKERAASILTGSGMVDRNFRLTGGASLAQEFADAGLDGKDFDDFSIYCVALHSLDREARGQATGEYLAMLDERLFPASERRRIIAEYDQAHPEFARAEAGFQRWRHALMQNLMVDTHRLSQQALDLFEQLYPHYVPSTRWADPNSGFTRGDGSSYTVRNARGGSTTLANPFDSIIGMTNAIVAQATQDNVAQAWHRAFTANDGLGLFARDITEDVREVSISSDPVIQRIRNELTRREADDLTAVLGGQMSQDDAVLNADAAMRAIENLFDDRIAEWQNTGGVDADGVLEVRMPPDSSHPNGTSVFYQFENAEMYRAIAGGSNPRSAFQSLARATRQVSQMITGSLPFAISNGIKDFQKSVNRGSWAASYADGAIKWWRAFRAVWYGQRGVETHGNLPLAEYRQWVAMGGGGWTRMNANTTQSMNEYRRDLFRGYGTATTGRRVGTAIRGVRDFLSAANINGAVESASRFAEFMSDAYDRTTEAGLVSAMTESQNVTTNFRRRGSNDIVRTIATFTPFFNAAVQGTFQNAHDWTSMDERGRLPARAIKTVVNTALASVLAAMLKRLFSRPEDLDEYMRGSAAMRAQNIMIPNPLHNVVPGAKPFLRFGLAQDPIYILINALAEDAVFSDRADGVMIDLGTIAESMLAQANPLNGTILDPILAVTQTNRTWYGGSVVPEWMRTTGVDVTNQYDEDTPQLAISISRWLNAIGIDIAPMGIEYLAQQYTGALGQFVLPVLSGGNAGVGERLLSGVRASVSRFAFDPLKSTDVFSRLYDAQDMLTSVKKTVKDGTSLNMLRRDLTDVQGRAAYDEAVALLSKDGLVGSASAAISDMYREIESIEGNESLTAAQRDDLIRAARMGTMDKVLPAQEAYAAWRQTYADGESFVTRMAVGKTIPVPTAMDDIGSIAAADWNADDPTQSAPYMRMAVEAWQASVDAGSEKSVLPEPIYAFTETKNGRSTEYVITEARMGEAERVYTDAYRREAEKYAAGWMTMTQEERVKKMQKAREKGRDAVKGWWKRTGDGARQAAEAFRAGRE